MENKKKSNPAGRGALKQIQQIAKELKAEKANADTPWRDLIKKASIKYNQEKTKK